MQLEDWMASLFAGTWGRPLTLLSYRDMPHTCRARSKLIYLPTEIRRARIRSVTPIGPSVSRDGRGAASSGCRISARKASKVAGGCQIGQVSVMRRSYRAKPTV